MWQYNELYHHGIKGQKWGVRRFQNLDGTLTPEGQKRYQNNDQGGSKKVTKNEYTEQEFQKKVSGQFKSALQKATTSSKKHANQYDKVDKEVYEKYKKEAQKQGLDPDNVVSYEDYIKTSNLYNEVRSQVFKSNSPDVLELRRLQKEAEKDYSKYQKELRAETNRLLKELGDVALADEWSNPEYYLHGKEAIESVLRRMRID